MSTKRSYSEETKAAAMAALLEGQSVNAVAKEYDVPKGTVSGWKRQAETTAGGGVAPDATQKEEIGALLVRYLRANLATLEAQARAFGDADWLSQQKAEAVAVLHGVMTDKAVRLLEAFGRAEGEESDV